MAGVSEAAFASRAEALFTKLRPGPGRPPSEVANHQRARIHRALVEAIVERSYDAVTVRELAARAGVSTRAFYQHYSSKDECFLWSHDLIVRRLVRGMVVSQAGGHDWRRRLRRTFTAFLHELESDVLEAHLVLVEAYGAGPPMGGQVRRAERTFEARIAECFARAPGEVEMPSLLVKGIMSALVCLARSRLLSGDETELSQLADDLATWALSLHDRSVVEVVDLDRRCARGDFATKEAVVSPNGGERTERAASGDQALVLMAVAKLVAVDGYRSLTVRRIREAAGIPPRSFDASFNDVEDCFIASFDYRICEAFELAAHAQVSATTSTGGIYRAITAICGLVASDPVFAGLCLGDPVLPAVQKNYQYDRVLAGVSRHIRKENVSVQPERDPAMEASVAAVWGVLHQHTSAGQRWQVPHLAGLLSYIALAPAVGAAQAARAIQNESNSDHV